MERRLLFILSLLLPTLLMANPVGKEQAQEKALSFVNGRSAAKARGPKAASNLRLVMSQDCYHVFNIGTGDGFVIVSGDDCAPDILGYADSGTIDPQSMPDNMKAWLQGYADEINWMKQNGITSSNANAKTRAAIKTGITPLVETIWGQNAPFNNYCPEYETGKKSVTGCVATAMAQVMYYHKCPSPTIPTVEIPAYDWNETTLGPLDATSFDWPNMFTKYSGSDEELVASTDANNSVAKLMKYCGYSVGMDYGASSGASSSRVADALKTYFKYASTTTYIVRSNYSYADWINIIYHELSQKRPVIYGGQSSGGGHEFIIDGYEHEDFFHVNWGWNGLSNAYFKLSALDPDQQGTGGSNSTDGYNFEQDATIGIQPVGGTGTILDITPNSFTLTLNSIKLSESTITIGQSVDVTMNITNNSDIDYDGDILVYGVGYAVLGGKMFLIPAGGAKDCIVTITPDFTGTIYLTALKGGRYYINESITKALTVNGSGGVTTDNIDLSTSATVEGSSDNEFYGKTYDAIVTFTNPSENTYNGQYHIEVTLGGSMGGGYGSTGGLQIPPGGSKDIPVSMNAYADATYTIYARYQKNSEWSNKTQIGSTFTAKPGITIYTADGSKNIVKATESYTVPLNAVFVDIRSSGVTNITKNEKANCLYLLRSTDTKPSDLTNVIEYDGSSYSAESISLTDGSDFYSPINFKANRIEFNYSFTQGADGTYGWNTLLLPFDVTSVTADGTAIKWFTSASDSGKNFWVKEFTNDAASQVFFNYASKIKANKPYIVAFPGDKWGSSWNMSGKSIKFIGENVTVYNSDALASITGDFYRFVGSTHAVSTENIYCLNAAGNKFELKATGGSTAFRAFFKPDIFDRTVTSLAIGGYEDPTGIDSIINSEVQEDGIYYNLKGQRIANPTKGLYILNGKKVVIK